MGGKKGPMAFQWIVSGCLAPIRGGLGCHVQEEGEECWCWSRASVGAWGRTGCVCYEWNVVVSSLKVRLLLLNCVHLFLTPWTAAHQASLFFTISWSLFKLMSIESVMPSNHLVLCRPLLLLSSVFPSIKAFSNESALCIRWPKYWGFRFSISPSNE